MQASHQVPPAYGALKFLMIRGAYGTLHPHFRRVRLQSYWSRPSPVRFNPRFFQHLISIRWITAVVSTERTVLEVKRKPASHSHGAAAPARALVTGARPTEIREFQAKIPVITGEIHFKGI